MIILEYSIKNAGRIKAVAVKPKPSGLTVIGGRNRQGKTTNLDMLCWGFGGDSYRPREPNHRGATTPAEIDIKTDNGLHIWRDGPKGALHVKDEKTSEKGNQSTIDKFITVFALDLRRFRDAKPKEKCNILLKTLGVDAELAVRQQLIDEAYERRKQVNRELKQREGALAQIQKPDDPPIDAPIKIDDLVEQLQDANRTNTAQQALARKRDLLSADIERDKEEIHRLKQRIEVLTCGINEKAEALKALPKPQGEVDTSSLQSDIATANQLNAQYAQVQQQRAEYDRLAKEADAAQKAALDAECAVKDARQAKMDLLAGVQMPDPDIGVADDGELTYRGDTWEQLADSDELILCCKIVSKLNPECHFVFVDGLEKLDPQTLMELDDWTTKANLQVIGTRVTTDPGEADLIIEDGQVAE
jgi:hypothetical protein